MGRKRIGADKNYILTRIHEADGGHETPCWVWNLSTNNCGYGMAWVKNEWSEVLAHRLAWRIWNGVIDGELDHLCRTRNCVRPSHLEDVTHRENMLRSPYSMRTHCPQGHPYDDTNTIVRSNGRKVCRTCKNAARRRSS